MPRVKLSGVNIPAKSSSSSETKFSITKFTHLWALAQFNLIPDDIEFVCSPSFSPPESKDEWFLKIRPKCRDDFTQFDYISVHLFLRKCFGKGITEIRANYAIHILDTDGDKRFSAVCSNKGGRIFKANYEGHGFKHMAPRSIILEHNQSILGPDSTLNILVEITAYGNFESKYTESSMNKLYSNTEIEQHSLLSNMNSLLNTMENADISVVTSDGKTMKCHKLLLANRSKVFEAMMLHDTNEKATESIKIADFYYSVVEAMVRFIYTDKVDDVVLAEYATQIIMIADKYDLPLLCRIAEEYIASKLLNFETAIQYYEIADFCNCEKLKLRILEFILENSNKICATSEWQKMIATGSNFYRDVFLVMINKSK
ncbi:speckle-type POZ protein-like protein [Leptotrombidium deliense]|uniref:Speckle-type POZ protein-like protein n=1 Tax=Leptotrombidium deliense TaxID=299467 RepID=A0A443SI39_9ACAR|nr:speckle-type POZ protein-like protein [Leptotrombidium deliense]